MPGSFDVNLGNISEHPGWTIVIVAGGGFLIVLVARIFWRQVKKLWAQAREGGVILSQPKRYMTRVFLPSFLSYVAKFAVIGIFLAAFAIPVTFESITWIVRLGVAGERRIVHPGSVGVTQATNALALDVCCNVPKNTAVAYSTAQQLITTAWNVLFATVLVIWVFGWSGGKTARRRAPTSGPSSRSPNVGKSESGRRPRRRRRSRRPTTTPKAASSLLAGAGSSLPKYSSSSPP